MTRKEALTDLLAKVEAGEPPTIYGRSDPCGLGQGRLYLLDANKGSIDAATAFHEAVLPEWDACVYLSGHAWVYIPQRNAPPEKEHRANNEIAARALLICDIKALIAECDE